MELCIGHFTLSSSLLDGWRGRLSPLDPLMAPSHHCSCCGRCSGQRSVAASLLLVFVLVVAVALAIAAALGLSPSVGLALSLHCLSD
jgi:hypothetical protein